MVWIKETKKQGEVSKNKNLPVPVPLRKAPATRRAREGAAAVRAQLETKRGRQAQSAQPRAALPSSPRPGESPARSLSPRPAHEEKPGGNPSAARGRPGQPTANPRLVPRALLSSGPGAMRPPTTSSCPGRALRDPWRRFLPLTLALFVGMGHAQRDPVGHYEPAGRDASRLWRPRGSHPAGAAAKVYSLFREQDAPVQGLPPAERAQPGWGSPRRPAETEARRPPRAQQPRRVRPPAQTWRSSPWSQQQPAPRARASPALPRFGTLQRPRAAPPAPPRGRLTG